MEKFVLFGTIHLATSITVLLLIVVFTFLSSKLDNKGRKKLGVKISAFLVIFYIAEGFFRHYCLNVPAIIMLPIHVCAALTFIGAYAHFKDNIRCHQIVFLWTFSLTLHSLVTPTPGDNYPSLEYFRYFCSHGIIILNAVYILVVLKVPITLRAVRDAFITLQILLIIAGVTNWLSGENFIFMHHKPGHPTLIDNLGPWPYYIFNADLLALIFFLFWFGVVNLFKQIKNRLTNSTI